MDNCPVCKSPDISSYGEYTPEGQLIWISCEECGHKSNFFKITEEMEAEEIDFVLKDLFEDWNG